MTSGTFHLNPFPGIRSYEIQEDELFFGRETQIAELIGKLSETRFLAIVGASGCGKSSMIRAGLIPALLKKKTQVLQADWKLTIFKPGDDPVRNLASALGDSVQQSEAIHLALKQGPNALVQYFREKKDPHHQLIVIDQFEELFRFRSKRNSVTASMDVQLFIKLFINAVSQSEIPVFIVLSMRTDFLDNCTEYRELSEMINRGYYLVPRMTKAERRLAITGPVQFKGARITDDLVERILCEIGDDPDQLPIMQHAMMRTWNYWTLNRIGDQPISMDHYESVGTMQEALSLHLEEVFNELKDQKSKFIAEKIFKALTDVGSDNRGTRRLARLSELCTLSGAREDDVVRVIDSFREPGRAFLMPPNQVRLNQESIIDISHESIMRVWRRLRRWVEDESTSAQLYLRLSQSAELYQQGKTGLWVNPELQLALQWNEQTKPNATWALRYNPAFERAMTFLDYSRKENDLAITKKEKQQKRNLKQARSFAVILGAAAVISILFLIISLNLRFKAEASQKEALEKQKLAVSESKRTEEQRSEAILQKRISDQQQQIAEQQKILTEQQRLYAVKQQGIAEEQTKNAVIERKKADTAKFVAVQARDEAETQKKEAVNQKNQAEKERMKAEESEKNTKRLRLLSVARSMAIQAAQISSSMKQDDLPALLALQAYKLNIENGGITNEPDVYTALSAISNDPKILRGHEDGVRDICMLPDHKTLVSASDDSRILLWNITDTKAQPVAVALPKGNKEDFRSLAVSQDGKLILAGSFTGRLFIWPLADIASQPRILNAHSSILNTIAVSTVNNCFVTGGCDGRLLLWTFAGKEYNPQMLDSVKGRINEAAFSPDGKSVVYACNNGDLKLCTLNFNDQSGGAKGKVWASTPALIMKCPDALLSVAFSPDGNLLAAGDSKGSIGVWKTKNLTSKPELLIGKHSTGVTCLAFSPDNSELASGGYDGFVKFNGNDARGTKSVTAGKHELWVYSLLYTPDGKKLISCGADKAIRIFSTSCKQMAETLSKVPKRNLTADEWNKYAGADIPYQKTLPELP